MAVVLQPSWTERARSLLATAGAASLVTGSPRAGATITPVPLEDRGDGLPLLRLDRESPAVAALASCRVATLVVTAPGAAWALRLLVSLRMGPPDRSGLRAYEPTLLSVRVTGPQPLTIPVDEFLRTAPDCSHASSESSLEHLGSVHADHLVAHVRGLGADAEVVVALAVSASGIEVALLSEEGVDRRRIAVADVCACVFR